MKTHDGNIESKQLAIVLMAMRMAQSSSPNSWQFVLDVMLTVA